MMLLEDVRHMKKGASERHLIDRQWPRGVVRAIPRKEESGAARRTLAEIKWHPQLAPSAALWQWYQSNPDKADRFRMRYFKELESQRSRWLPILQKSRKGGPVALLYQAKDLPQTPAHFFKEFLDAQGARGVSEWHERPSGRSGQGLHLPAGKVQSRKGTQPIKEEEASLKPKLRLKSVAAEKRRVLR